MQFQRQRMRHSAQNINASNCLNSCFILPHYPHRSAEVFEGESIKRKYIHSSNRVYSIPQAYILRKIRRDSASSLLWYDSVNYKL